MINSIKKYVFDKDYKIIIYKDKINIVNYKKIRLITEKKVIIALEDRKIIINGSDLKLKKMIDDELYLSGIISGFEVQNDW